MLIDGKKWVAFFSHTGNEIYNVSKLVGRFPDVVITNNKPDSKSLNARLLSRVGNVVWMNNRPEEGEYHNVLNDVCDNCVITLHGWMRIIPKSVCKQHTIYNLHPGLISKYPELKGADPQKRVVENDDDRYKFVGCVIHKVIAKVDEGKILAETSVRNVYPTEKLLSCRLHEMATELWVQFLDQETDQYL